MSQTTPKCETTAGNQVFEPPVAPKMAPKTHKTTRKNERQRQRREEREKQSEPNNPQVRNHRWEPGF